MFYSWNCKNTKHFQALQTFHFHKYDNPIAQSYVFYVFCSLVFFLFNSFVFATRQLNIVVWMVPKAWSFQVQLLNIQLHINDSFLWRVFRLFFVCHFSQIAIVMDFYCLYRNWCLTTDDFHSVIGKIKINLFTPFKPFPLNHWV